MSRLFMTGAAILAMSAVPTWAQENDGPRGIDSQACKQLIGKLLSGLPPGLERIEDGDSETTVSFIYRRDSGYGFLLVCDGGDYRSTGVDFDWQRGPDRQSEPFAYSLDHKDEWFALSAQAGTIVTGEDTMRLDTAEKECVTAALKEKSGFAERKLPKAEIDCKAKRLGDGVDWNGIEIIRRH